MTTNNTKINLIRKIVILQAVIAIYCCSTVVAKFASQEDMLSMNFVLLYGVEIAILGVYAILWQQVIKHFPITVAYSNRAVGLLWSVLFALVIFHEKVTMGNVIGVIIVIAGTMVVNSEDE